MAKTSTSYPKSGENLPMLCENFMRSVFGDKKYYGTASAFNNDQYFVKEMCKAVKAFRKKTESLQASEKFKDYLVTQLEYLYTELGRTDLDRDAKGLIVVNMKIVATLLGYHYSSGDQYEEPYFIPTVWAEQQGWINQDEYRETQDKLRERTRNLVGQLTNEGFTLAETASILNISAYKVAQLKQQLGLTSLL